MIVFHLQIHKCTCNHWNLFQRKFKDMFSPTCNCGYVEYLDYHNYRETQTLTFKTALKNVTYLKNGILHHSTNMIEFDTFVDFTMYTIVYALYHDIKQKMSLISIQ
eukprot:GHVU01233603.1.p1 GENE.GHVU01233603.1~~GHVU01233603.1.p1  ORF type:complete len:106 (-),score=6.15 GHVU01233603.1:420-737(-)